MANQRAFHFGRADAMAGDVEHVVDTAHDPEVTVLVLAASVACEVAARDLGPVSFLVAGGVSPNAPQHGRPRLADHQLAAGILRHGLAGVIHDLG